MLKKIINFIKNFLVKMANKEPKLKHIRSGVKGKYPTTTNLINGESKLDYGEIAINYNKDNEFIVIRNSENETVEFITKNQVQTKIDAEKERAISAETDLNSDLLKTKTELIDSINGKNVSASGETGDSALINASANNNEVTVNSTTKLQNAVNKAETALQSISGDDYIKATKNGTSISLSANDKLKTIESTANTSNDAINTLKEGVNPNYDTLAKIENRIKTDTPVTITPNNSEQYFNKYTFTQNGNTIGTINIPKDLVVNGGEIETVKGVKNLVLTIANQTDKVYIPVNELVDVYANGDYITISDDNKISVKYNDLDAYLASSEASVGKAIKVNTVQIATLNTDVSIIKNDYLTDSDKIELNNKIDNIKGSIDGDLSSYLKIVDAESTYLSQENGEYLGELIEENSSKINTLDTKITDTNNRLSAVENGYVKNGTLDSYLKIADAENTYLSQENGEYLGELIEENSSKINTLDTKITDTNNRLSAVENGYVKNGTLDSYLKIADAENTYLSLTGGTITNGLGIEGNLNVIGENNTTTIYGNLRVKGNADIEGYLKETDLSNYVQKDDAIIYSDLIVSQMGVVNDGTVFRVENSTGNATIKGNLTVNGDINGYLTKTEAMNLYTTTATVNGLISNVTTDINNRLTTVEQNYLDTTTGGAIDGNLDINGVLSVGSNINLPSDSVISGTDGSNTQGNIIFSKGTVTLQNINGENNKSLIVNNDGVAINGNLSVSGNINGYLKESDLDNYLDTTKGGTVNGSLNVVAQDNGTALTSQGITQIIGEFVAKSNGTPQAKTLTLNGDGVNISGDLSVSGDINLKAASSSKIGGVKIGYSENNQNYPVELDNDNKMFVNVPWTDNNTTYTVGSGLNMVDNQINHNTISGITTSQTFGPDGNLLNATSFELPEVTYDIQGHITNVEMHTCTIKDTTYTAATDKTLGLVKIGDNITNEDGTISLTNNNITNALGYIPFNSDGGTITYDLDVRGNFEIKDTNEDGSTKVIKIPGYAKTEDVLSINGGKLLGDFIVGQTGVLNGGNVFMVDHTNGDTTINGDLTVNGDINGYVKNGTLDSYLTKTDAENTYLSQENGEYLGELIEQNSSNINTLSTKVNNIETFYVSTEGGDTINGDLTVSGNLTGKTITELNNKIDAIEGAVSGDLSGYLTKTEAESIYLSQENGEYLGELIEDNSSNINALDTKVTDTNNRLSAVEGSLDDYLKESDADSKYMSKDNESFSNMYIDADGTFEAYPDNFIIAYPQNSDAPNFSIKGDTLGNGVNIESVDGVTITGDLTVNGLINGDIEFGSDNFKTNGINLNLLSQYSVLNGQDVTVIASNTAYDRTIYDIDSLEHNGLISNTEYVKLESVFLDDEGEIDNIFLRIDKNGIYLESEKGIGINGDVLSTGTITAKNIVNTSDLSLKDVIKEEVITVDDIANAPLFTYTLKDDINKTQMIGTSAQYWKEVLPQVVFGEEGKYSLAYSNLAVASSISLAKEVKSLKDENEMLKNEMKELKEMINQIINK